MSPPKTVKRHTKLSASLLVHKYAKVKKPAIKVKMKHIVKKN